MVLHFESVVNPLLWLSITFLWCIFPFSHPIHFLPVVIQGCSIYWNTTKHRIHLLIICYRFITLKAQTNWIFKAHDRISWLVVTALITQCSATLSTVMLKSKHIIWVLRSDQACVSKNNKNIWGYICNPEACLTEQYFPPVLFML